MTTHEKGTGSTLLADIVAARESLEAANAHAERSVAELRASLNVAFGDTDKALEAYLAEFENAPKLEIPDIDE